MQLKKNDVVTTSSQDEALARYRISREVPCSVLKWESVLGSLDDNTARYDLILLQVLRQISCELCSAYTFQVLRQISSELCYAYTMFNPILENTLLPASRT